MQRIESFLKNVSRIYRHTSSDFVEIFCPFCNDSARKHNPNHGHLYLSMNSNYFKCFRCNEVGSVTRLLSHLGFSDAGAIAMLKSSSRDDISYFKKIKNRPPSIFESVELKRSRAASKYIEISDTEDFKRFYAYMVHRCLDINFSNYFVFPERKFDKLVCSFYNYDNRFITSRFIDAYNMRYYNSKIKTVYYFQDITRIMEYSNIVICEGVFDLINLHNYHTGFNNTSSFYIAMNGSSYVQTVRAIISTYLIIGTYTISIVFDKGVIGINQIIKKIRYQIDQWNNQIQLDLYEPLLSKDVSELICLEKINM